MALKDHPLPPDALLDARTIPPDVEALILDAERRAEAFGERPGEALVVSFVQSDLRRAWRVLTWIRERGLVPGRRFCEWGSGLGAVALLAARAGFWACGIEVEGDLVEIARSLASDHHLDVEFARGSFLPEDADVSPQDMEEFAWINCSADPAYEELGLDLDEFDLIYGFPWPGEQAVLYDLFDAYASPGAYLMTQHGIEGTRLHRKV